MSQTFALPASRPRSAVLPAPRAIAHDTFYLLAGLPLGILAFTVAVTGLALAAGLAITLLGIPVLLLTLLAARAFGRLERLRAAPVLGTTIAAHERASSGGLWQRTRVVMTDPGAWRAALWSLLLLPLGTAGFTVAVTFWSAALGLASSPLWYWALPEDNDTIPLLDDVSLPYSALRVLIGLALIPIAALVCRGVAVGTAKLAQVTLTPAG